MMKIDATQNKVAAEMADSAKQKRNDKMKSACQDFEALFLGHLLKSMRKTVIKSDLLGPSKEEELFREIMDNEISKSISRTDSVGIASLLYRQLTGENR